MKKSNWSIAFLVFLMFLFIFLPNLIQAQPGGPPDPDCPPDIVCPIDSGLIALIAVGVGYGVKKIRHQRKVSSVS